MTDADLVENHLGDLRAFVEAIRQGLARGCE